MTRYGRYFRYGPNNIRTEHYLGENTSANARDTDPVGRIVRPRIQPAQEQEEEGEVEVSETGTPCND